MVNNRCFLFNRDAWWICNGGNFTCRYITVLPSGIYLASKTYVLYGQWDDDFFDSVGEMTEDARNVTIVYIGYMLGVEAATKVVGNIVAKATSRGFIIKTLIKSALGREMIIKIVRAIGIKIYSKSC